jgi:hypothetical protein
MGLWHRAKKAAQVLCVSGIAAYLGWLGVQKQPVGSAPEQGLVRRIQREHAFIALLPTAVSPDRKRVACIGSIPGNPAPDVYVYGASDKSLENITNSGAPELDARWLDNERLKYFTEQGWQWRNTRTGETGSVPSPYLPYGMLLGGLFGLPLAALAAVGLAKRRKKERIVDAAGRNTGLAAGLSFAATAAAVLCADYAFRMTSPEQCNAFRHDYLGAAAGVSVLAALGAGIASLVKPPRVRNFFKRLRYALQVRYGSYETQCAALRNAQDVVSNPEALELAKAAVELQYHHLDEGLLALQRGLAHLSQEAAAPDELKVPFTPLIGDIDAALRRKNPASALTASLRALVTYDFDRALQGIDLFVQEDPALDRKAARALYVQSVADTLPVFRQAAPGKTAAFEQSRSPGSLTSRFWHETIDGVLRDPRREQNFRIVGESRNEVIKCAKSPFLQGLLVLKRCDAEHAGRLARERKHVLALRGVHGERIAQSLALIEHDGKCYHVLRHVDGITLETLLQQGAREQQDLTLRDTVHFLASLHRYTPADREQAPQGAWYYHDRLVTTFCNELKKMGAAVPVGVYAALEGASKAVFGGLRGAPVGFYKDANPRNWLVEKGKGKGKDRVVAIDFEHGILLPVYLDLVSLLEFGPSPVDDFLRMDMLHEYYERAMPAVEYDRFLEQYRYAALQRHMELAGYRARDREHGAVLWHVNRAIYYAKELGQEELAHALADTAL